MRGSKRYREQVEMGLREGACRKKLKAAEHLTSDAGAENLPRSRAGWQGAPGLPEDARDLADVGEDLSLDELERRGMQLICWNGVLVGSNLTGSIRLKFISGIPKSFKTQKAGPS